MSVEEIDGKTYDIWSYWKMLPKDYRCPVCDRQKKDIVRYNRHGHIMMHIGSNGICEDCTGFRTKMREKYRQLSMTHDEAILYAYVQPNVMHEEDLHNDNS